jgi:hypothetical protein
VTRVALLAGLFLLFAILFSADRAVARVKSEMMRVGEHLMAFADPGTEPRVRDVLVNGQSLRFAVLTTDQPVAAVLDHYERWCMQRDGRFAEQLDQARAKLPGGDAVDSSLLDATLREGGDDQGFVGCFDAGGAGKLTPDDAAARFERFADTGNLADLGRFYYMFAERGAERTRLIAAWIDGDFYPARLFPATGDAPGSDVAGIPRPPGGRRLLSARQADAPYGWTIYERAGHEPAAVAAHYRQALPALGWGVTVDREVEPGTWTLAIARDGDTAILTIVEEGGGTVVSIATAAPEGEP